MKNGFPAPGSGVRTAGAAALAVLAIAAACAKPAVPVRLGGLVRSKVLTGERAVRAIGTLHGSAVAPQRSFVADYGRRSELKLYVSHFPGPAGAQRAMSAMLAGLRGGRTPFRPPRRDDRWPDRWFTVGPGGHHVVWLSGSSVYWLAGAPDRLERAMEELPAPSRGEWT
jgi:hypothetical protein